MDIINIYAVLLTRSYSITSGRLRQRQCFFTVSGLSLVKPLLWRHCHWFDLISTLLLHFNLLSSDVKAASIEFALSGQNLMYKQ
jgi:hypothetical protein